MTNDQINQALIGWAGDIPSLLTEMKRRAGVGSDRDLAKFMGVSQSTVSHWRTREAIPEAAILKFERAFATADKAPQLFAARVVLLRLAEFWYQDLKAKGASGGRRIPYQMVALTANTLLEVLSEHITKYQSQTGLSAFEVADHMVEDQQFLTSIIDWLRDAGMADMIAQEGRFSKATLR